MSDTNMKHMIATVTLAVGCDNGDHTCRRTDGGKSSPNQRIRKKKRTQTPVCGRSPQYRYTDAVTLGTSSC